MRLQHGCIVFAKFAAEAGYAVGYVHRNNGAFADEHGIFIQTESERFNACRILLRLVKHINPVALRENDGARIAFLKERSDKKVVAEHIFVCPRLRAHGRLDKFIGVGTLTVDIRYQFRDEASSS